MKFAPTDFRPDHKLIIASELGTNSLLSQPYKSISSDWSHIESKPYFRLILASSCSLSSGMSFFERLFTSQKSQPLPHPLIASISEFIVGPRMLGIFSILLTKV